jgi:hypothetical protein
MKEFAKSEGGQSILENETSWNTYPSVNSVARFMKTGTRPSWRIPQLLLITHYTLPATSHYSLLTTTRALFICFGLVKGGA